MDGNEDILPQTRRRAIDNQTARRFAYHYIGLIALSSFESGSEWHEEAAAGLGGTQADADAIQREVERIAKRFIKRGIEGQPLTRGVGGHAKGATP